MREEIDERGKVVDLVEESELSDDVALDLEVVCTIKLRNDMSLLLLLLSCGNL